MIQIKSNLDYLDLYEHKLIFKGALSSQYPIYEHKLKKNQIIPNYLFTGDDDGNLKQWHIEQQKLVKDFDIIHSGQIQSITATNDGRYLFTSGTCGELKQWDIEQGELMKDFGEIHSGGICSISA